MNKITNIQLRKFLSIANALSPENLSCDGELSRTQVQARYKKLKKDWSDLEKEVGFTVTEETIYQLEKEYSK